VFFPTGVVEEDDTLLIYYGAADAVTGVTGVRMRDIMATLIT